MIKLHKHELSLKIYKVRGQYPVNNLVMTIHEWSAITYWPHHIYDLVIDNNLDLRNFYFIIILQ